MTMPRLSQQMAFLVEADKLKAVSRRTPLVDGSRLENSAEHSWHLVLAAMIMRQYSAQTIDLLRVLEMAAVHDLVEIDAGDTFAYDVAGQVTKTEREAAAAARVFGLLPSDQCEYVAASGRRCSACGCGLCGRNDSDQVRPSTGPQASAFAVCPAAYAACFSLRAAFRVCHDLFSVFGFGFSFLRDSRLVTVVVFAM